MSPSTDMNLSICYVNFKSTSRVPYACTIPPATSADKSTDQSSLNLEIPSKEHIDCEFPQLEFCTLKKVSLSIIKTTFLHSTCMLNAHLMNVIAKLT